MTGGWRTAISAAFVVVVALVAGAGCARNVPASDAAAVPAAPAAASAPLGQAQYIIHKPSAEVFEALVNPAITAKFWIVHGTDRLGPGKEVRWDLPGGVSTHIKVLAFEPNQRLLMEWWSERLPATTVEWLLTSESAERTRLGVIHSGFTGNASSVAIQARDSTAGFTTVLAALKTLLEHDLQGNLVADGAQCRTATTTSDPAEATRGRAAVLVRKPPAVVFEAMVNPAITTRFWFVEGSGRLEPGKQVQWVFPGKVAANVAVREFEADRRLLLEWWVGAMRPEPSEWVFTPAGDGGTCVRVTTSGFNGPAESLQDKANYSTGGFTYVLANLKLYLEHGIKMPHSEFHERVKR